MSDASDPGRAGDRARHVDAVVGELVGLAREDPTLLQFRSRASAHQFLPLYREVLRQLPRDRRVLDWGTGNGHFAYFLARSGFDVTAYAYATVPGRLAAAHARCVVGEDPAKLPFPDASFDAVCSVGVLEHVRETGGREEQSLREIRRVLVPGGLFLCFHLPNRFSWIETLASAVPGKHVHPFRYTKREVRALFAAAGFSVLRCRRYGLLPRNALAPLGASRAAARGWDWAERALAVPFSLFAQNFAVVARAPLPPASHDERAPHEERRARPQRREASAAS